ncbi:hypothetical protein BDN72DRAFT_848574 [Pluteus cervinus]|uniref:Uncharacterized protein n=1 Tax=Pluteus cervinus TaxID=181527 RepID=A0ACD3AAR5_9AGAR|nr:hypothetical protein BDN72DRAFT_848574 [Pluteus cervinus]
MAAGQVSTTLTFSNLPGVSQWGTGDITRGPNSYGSARTAPSVATTTEGNRNIARSEPCFITKKLSYTHERMHWVSAARTSSTTKGSIEKSLRDLDIVPASFDLNDASNLTNLDRVMHTSLDRYALIAVTCSSDTLDQLIALLKIENENMATAAKRGDRTYVRQLRSSPAFLNAQYELVALHPKHLLPNNSELLIYDHSTPQPTRKTYVTGSDNNLREWVGEDDTGPRIPAFSFDLRPTGEQLNPFLVILNAVIKFRRYDRITSPKDPLPSEITELMEKTKELVELIYWKPSVEQDGDDQHSEGYDEVGAGFTEDNGQMTLEEQVAYNLSFLSDHSQELTAEEEDFLVEIYGPNALEVPEAVDVDQDPESPRNLVDKVTDWQRSTNAQEAFEVDQPEPWGIR